MVILFIVLGLLVILAAVLLLRAAAFKPKTAAAAPAEPVDFDRERAVTNLQALVRCRTVSRYDHSLEDDGEFEKLIALLPQLYPHVWERCPLTRMDDRALLFKWEGRAHDEPSVMMAHYDVVPVDESGWTKPAFDGLIEDGVLWGRGTLDTKNTFNGALSAADHLIAAGFVPAQDVYFAFSGGEEVNGPGAVHIVDWFRAQGITPALVVDEGGAVVANVFPGVSAPCGLIGIAEKGMMNLSFTVESAGGHASAPKPGSPLVKLSEACCRVENRPFPFHLTKPVAEMFDTLGRYSSFGLRVVFANLWLFRGVLDALCKKSGGVLNALVRTTVAFTQASGSSAPNVIPPEAKLVANLRLNPMDSTAGAAAYVRNLLDGSGVEIAAEGAMEPSPISETGCPAWNKVASAVGDTWGCIVSPYLMVQCSDSRHYGPISRHVYRFSAADMTEEERDSIHGNDEHIRVETVRHAVEFYIRLLRQC